MLKRPLLWRKPIASHSWPTSARLCTILLPRAGYRVAKGQKANQTPPTYRYMAASRSIRLISSRDPLSAAKILFMKTCPRRTIASWTKMNVTELTKDWRRKDSRWALSCATMTTASTHQKTIKRSTIRISDPWRVMSVPGLEFKMINLTFRSTMAWLATSNSHYRNRAQVRLKPLPLRRACEGMPLLSSRLSDPSSTTLTWSRKNRTARVT